jgi:hypothetical protein
VIFNVIFHVFLTLTAPWMHVHTLSACNVYVYTPDGNQVIFNVIFTLEAVAKILSLGSFMRYIVQPINTFDFSLVVVSDLLMILSLGGVQLPNVSFFRALRLLRAFLMITRFHRLRLLFRRSAASLQSTFSVMMLLFFFLAAFALLGMQIFKCEMPECEQGPDGKCLDPLAKCTNSMHCALFSEELQVAPHMP